MAASTKPALVLVPGAWHTPTHYEKLLSHLRSLGFETVCLQNPSCDASDPNEQSAAKDAAAIRENALLPLLDADRDVVFMMHSYGGKPGGAAAKGLDKASRQAEGKRGAVIGLIYICAFVAKEGESLVSKLPGNKLDPWVAEHPETGQLTVTDPVLVFYNGVAEADAEDAVAGLKNQARASFTTPSPPPAWLDKAFDGRRAYYRCLEDQAMPAIAQQMMVEQSGVEWEVKAVQVGHSPFLSAPEGLGEWVKGLAEKWA